MPDVFLPAINPVDESYDNTNVHDPAPPVPSNGGLLGDGDLTSDDGDASGWEAWNANTSNVGDPGVDLFRYAVDTSALPTGATITGYRFEMTVRLLAESSPQGYARPHISPSWSEAGGNYFDKLWLSGDDFFNYVTYASATHSPAPGDMVADVVGGTATLWFSASPRGSGIDLSPVRCTMAGIRVYYTLPDTPAVTHAPPLRQYPRSDGLATSSARRMWPPSRSTQGSLRHGAGTYL